MRVRIYRINKGNPLPVQANPNDAGFDLFVSENVFFSPDEIKLVPTGIIAEAPEGFHWKLCLRSSMAKKRGFMLANGVGIIDSNFCGPQDEIKVLLKAPPRGYDISANGNYMIKKGERIAQLILEQNNQIEWDEQADANFKGQSRGGFGSSGI